MKKAIKTFNVICEQNGNFKYYDIMNYLINCYKYDKKRKWKYKKEPVTFDDFKDYIKNNSLYQWWGRCEYELVLSDWPCQKKTEKWDIHKQVMMNIDIITEIFMENVSIKQKGTSH